METQHNVNLSSVEIANLWTAYMNNSMSVCVLTYFAANTNDTEIKSLVEFALECSQKNCQEVRAIFEEENYPVPFGFTQHDVNLKAPKLWTDILHINYLDQMSKAGFLAFGFCASLAARLDVREYFNRCLIRITEINNRTKNLLLEKGLFLRPPTIAAPKQVDFVQKQGFLTGWFGERKPLLAMEIMHLYHNIQTNAIGKAIIMGFAQVASSKDVRDFMLRGKEIAVKHIEIFSSLLRDEDIPVPTSWDSDVLDSTLSPFSEKLMLFHVAFLSAAGIGNYGSAISISTRRDIITHYSRLVAEVGLYTEDGANLMINHGWLEEPPQAIKRAELINK